MADKFAAKTGMKPFKQGEGMDRKSQETIPVNQKNPSDYTPSHPRGKK